jgi:hypothetical protein
LPAAALLCAILFSWQLGCASDAQNSPADDALFDPAEFRDPPRALAPRIRFWWPGGAVDDETLGAELLRLDAAGYGGVEVQTLTLGLSAAEVEADARIRTVGEAEYLAHLRYFAAAARALGLAWDLTLGSGWPSGGPALEMESERQLLMATTRVTGPRQISRSIPRPEPPRWVISVNNILPAIGPFDDDLALLGVVAAPLLDVTARPPVLGAILDLAPFVRGDSLNWQAPPGDQVVIAFYANRVSHYVLGHAFPGRPEASQVIDHLDPAGIRGVLETQGDPWLDAVAESPPDTVFVDSFELVGDLPWSEQFAARFEEIAGYSLLPYLPFVFRDGGEAKYVEILRGEDLPAFASEEAEIGLRAREDYEQVRAVLFRAAFIDEARDWAQRRGVGFRLQAHGGYSDSIDDYAAADVAESEGLYAGGRYDFLKLAASAAHLGGRNVVSSESFVLTDLRGTNPLSLDELWLLAGRAFAAGITRLVHHGYAYPYRRANGEAWYPFRPGDGATTAGPLTITTEFRPGTDSFAFLPAFNTAQTRISYAMTRGRHRADVAWLMPKRQFRDVATLVAGPLVPEQSEDEISLAVRRRGYVYDRVSREFLTQSRARDGQLSIGEARYRLLLLSDLDTAEPELMEAIEAAVDGGVPVVVIGDLPLRAPGLRDRERRDALVAAAAARLRAGVERADGAEDAARALVASGVLPALRVVAGEGTLSVERRELAGEQLFFLFNESFEARTWQVEVSAAVRRARLYDPEDGESRPVELTAVGGRTRFTLSLPAARGRILDVER